MSVRQLNIKNKTYYFYSDLINVLNFKPSNLKLDTKTRKDIDIYYIGFIDKTKPEDWHVNSVNPLYLMINKVFCSFGEENGVKYLKIKKNHSEPALNKWNLVFDSIKSIIKKINNEKCKKFSGCLKLSEINFIDGFNKIKFISDDFLREDKLIYFPTLTVVLDVFLKKMIYIILKFI